MALHPLDFAALKKGDVIGQAQLERVFGFTFSVNPDGYRFATLGLQSQIEREREDLISRTDHLGIIIMHDIEAEHYLRRRLAGLVAALGRVSGRRVRIDRSEFEPAVKRAGESMDRSAQGIALMARSAHRKAVRAANLFLCAPDPTSQLGEGEVT